MIESQGTYLPIYFPIYLYIDIDLNGVNNVLKVLGSFLLLYLDLYFNGITIGSRVHHQLLF